MKIIQSKQGFTPPRKLCGYLGGKNCAAMCNPNVVLGQGL